MFNFVIEAHLFKFAMLVVYSGFTTLCGRYFGDIGGANLHGGTYFSCINICFTISLCIQTFGISLPLPKITFKNLNI